MSRENIYFEAVRAGHPDKICDFIADSILDACFEQDKRSRVACECFFAGKNLILGGEISTSANIDPVEIAKKAIDKIGYNSEDFEYTNYIATQSPEISNLVGSGEDLGAGDQGVVIGYAKRGISNEHWAFDAIKQIMIEIDKAFYSGILPGIKPDGKGFISVSDERNRVHISYECEGDEYTNRRQTKIRQIVDYVLDHERKYNSEVPEEFEVTFIEYHLGGPLADSGLTGRKQAVDTYGGAAPLGGGSFSGKDPTKVDRTGAYFARQLAITALNDLEAEEVEITLGYAIGESHPVSLSIKCNWDDTAEISIDEIEEYRDNMKEKVLKSKDFNLNNIINSYYMGESFEGFAKLASYGHFGNPNCPWEKIIEL